MMKARARVTVTVEINVIGENWNEHTDIGSLHREAKELAVKQITDLCERSRAVSMVGTPKVEAMFVEDQKHGR